MTEGFIVDSQVIFVSMLNEDAAILTNIEWELES